MALDKQINIYSVDTGDFYSNKERYLHNKNAKLRKENKYINNARKQASNADEEVMLNKLYAHKRDVANKIKKKLLKLLSNKVKQNKPRCLNEKNLSENNIISVFDSSLTRTMGLAKDEFTENMIIVQVYYFDVFKDISYNGFYYKGEKYIYLTSSAGQIRKKKAVFIKEQVWKQHEKTIMCGLTIDKINSKGGNNVNKHLAYLALSNSATDEWVDFDIDKSIVIDDFETMVTGVYDFIDEKDYSVTRKNGAIPICHTDGAGICLYGKNKMIRLPWIKGLLGKIDYISLIQEKGWSPVIKDIYGLEHNIIDEGIEVIFTKSQFKMAKYYDSWQQYKDYFKKYNCKPGYCNEEEDKIKNSKINYQELQTLTDTTDLEREYLTKKSNDKLQNMCKTKQGLFDILNINPYNTNLTPLQKAVKIYPNLLNDEYLKSTIRDVKNSLLKKYRSGKLEVTGKYTFILPDLYAACEYWFGHISEPTGLLADGTVFCNLFFNSQKVDCLRSPHLYKEHSIRYNMACRDFAEQRELIQKWFTTNAIYTSCHDLISKILQFDCDGDKSLVIGDAKFVEIAERNMIGVVPLYYNMQKAQSCLLNAENIYKGLSYAFSGGNIGIYSNNISKIWNSDVFVNGTDKRKQECIDVIKLLCCENNFCIDMAKTLYMPKRPKDAHEKIKKFTNKKLPHFFVYAKDKEIYQVEKANHSFVNELQYRIKDVRLNFRGLGLQNIDYKLLMSDTDIQVDQNVIEQFKKINSEWHFKIGRNVMCNDDDDINTYAWIKKDITNQLSQFGYSQSQICDILVKELYGKKRTWKETLWFCYGDNIVENLQKNIKYNKTKNIRCVDCGEWFEASVESKRIRCDICYKKERRRIHRENAKNKK